MTDAPKDPLLDPEEDAFDIDVTTPRDHLKNLTLAIAQSVPGVASVVALLDKYIPNQREARLTEFVRELAYAFKRLEDRVNEGDMINERFAGLYEEATERASSRRHHDKREYYAAMIANAATPEHPEEEEQWRMIDALDELRPNHLRLLAVIATSPDGPPDVHIGSGEATLRWRLPAIDTATLRLDWTDLERLHIIEAYPSGIGTRASLGLSQRLTEVGRRFIQFTTIDGVFPEPPTTGS